ncbi:hypothetical protein EYF80_010126 [Liparis tanakae]|uniref:Uncharacterized protein n=1 Tax=Liparis tanakae TaxID=230148 RepID=A0A4Z2IPX4_9TELE|nr:hypothetical protein EYF80_010126 [Liparis tanakae]
MDIKLDVEEHQRSLGVRFMDGEPMGGSISWCQAVFQVDFKCSSCESRKSEEKTPAGADMSRELTPSAGTERVILHGNRRRAQLLYQRRRLRLGVSGEEGFHPEVGGQAGRGVELRRGQPGRVDHGRRAG